MIISQRYKVWLLLIVLAILWFSGLPARHLADPDEGRYAEIPLRMLLTGDWINPRLNGLKYFEKPPLQYWATATAYTLFGASEATSRLWTSLTGFLAVLATCYAGTRLFGLRAGIYAGQILISSSLFESRPSESGGVRQKFCRHFIGKQRHLSPAYGRGLPCCKLPQRVVTG